MSSHRWVRLIIALFASSGLIILATYSWHRIEKHLQRQAEQRVHDLVQEHERLRSDAYDRAHSDTDGGTTPRATLQQYHDALLRGDEQSVVMIFVPAERERARTQVRALMRRTDERDRVARLVSLAAEAPTASDPGRADGEQFVVAEPLFIRAVRYPNGTWKLISI